MCPLEAIEPPLRVTRAIRRPGIGQGTGETREVAGGVSVSSRLVDVNENLHSHFDLSRLEWAVPRKAAPPPPRQARSRETLKRLLDAAEKVIARHGLEGATLPRIARQARVSPANVYRRFRDKDALIAAVFSRFSDMQAEHADQTIDSEPIRKMGLRPFVRQWIGALVASYRAQAGLMRATIEYSRKNAERPFIKRQVQLEGRSFDKMAEALLIFRDEIRHPDPELAVRWAMLMPGFALRELLLFDKANLTGRLVPMDDPQLQEELVRAFLGYLGVDAEE